METLTQKVLQYQKTGQGLRSIVEEISPRIYQFPRRTMGWDEDACGDFYVFIHPRLIRLLGRFRDQGKPFESYLWSVLNWQLRNFARDRSRSERRWQVSLRLEPGELVSRDSASARREPCAREDLTGISRCLRSDADRRNFLFLLLKCSRRLDPENASSLAPLAGVSVRRLLGLAEELRLLGTAREARRDLFLARRNRSYAAVCLLQTELRSEVSPDRQAELERSLNQMRSRMRFAMRRMSRVGLAPTNREIGRVLGVPKGTVDSGLYWLKRKLALGYDAGTFRPAS